MNKVPGARLGWAVLALVTAVRLGAEDVPRPPAPPAATVSILEAEQELRRLAELLPKAETPEARTACLQAQAALLRLLGRLEEALAILRLLPDTPASRVEQALLLSEQGQFSLAEEILKKFSAGGTGDPGTAARALYLLASVYLKTGRQELAEPLWQRLADQYPDAAVRPAALLARYESLRVGGKTGQAAAVLAELEQRYPQSPELALAQGGQEVRYAAAPYRLLEPAEAAPPAAASESAPRPGKALVQTGSFRDPENARFLVRDLQQKGFAARIVELQIDTQRYYRVVMGGDLATADAEGILLRLKEAGFAGVILQQD